MSTSRRDAPSLLARLDSMRRELPVVNTAAVRGVRRALTSELKKEPIELIQGLAELLIDRDRTSDRFVAYELIAADRRVMADVRARLLRQLGRGMDSWEDVDTFACYVAGPVWREGNVGNDEIRKWAHSPDRWWRRAAVVSTVALNNKARGGKGDVERTIAICELVIHDRDPMVVKALSWALRALSQRSPSAVQAFLERYDEDLPALVKREVRTKLRTGLKSGRRSKASR